MENKTKQQIIALCQEKPQLAIRKIAHQFNTNRTMIHKILREEGIDRQLLKFNHNFFEKIDTQKKAYWLGFIFADGGICDTTDSTKSLNIKLSATDDNHLKTFQSHICSKLNLHYGNTENTAYVRYYSNKLCDDLIKLGCTPRKSLILKFPKIEQHFHRHFIRGYIDGDGCISYRKNGNRRNFQIVIVGTEDFLSSLQYLFFKELGVKHKKLQNKGKAKGLTINGNKQCNKIFKWIYQDSKIHLERKYPL